MAKTIGKYELMFIVDLDLGEEQMQSVIGKFKTLIEENGTLLEFEELGRKRLAYLINDKPEGYYVLLRYTSPPEFPSELERVMKITDGVMRWITVALED